MSRDVKEFLERLRLRGWTIVEGGKHIKCYCPIEGAPLMVVARTPSCGRAVKNMEKMALRIESGIARRIERKGK